MIVYKFQLETVEQVLEFRWPKGSKIIHAAEQNGHHFMWVLMTTDTAFFEDRKFFVIGTGIEMPKEVEHVKTWISGMFVWHLFEVYV